MTYNEVCKRLKQLEKHEYVQSIANDYYFSSQDYKETRAEIQRLESLKKELENE